MREVTVRNSSTHEDAAHPGVPMMERMTPAPAAVHTPPARIRGTLALVAGRGEGADVYARFGARLSADGYAVGVFGAGADAAAWLAAQPGAPRVLVGSDAGATAVLHALARDDVADAAIVAGLPVGSGRTPSDAERTACPLHLRVLSGQGDAEQGDAGQGTATGPESGDAAVEDPVADYAAISVPVLAFHGSADPVAPVGDAHAALASVPDLEFVETVEGLHDALNDASHRSVAATIVLWLERLRAGDVHAPIVRSFAEVAS